MNRAFVVAVLLGGCGSLVEPGHRGLYFDTRHGGLQREVLRPGWHRVGLYGRVDDFDVTYSTRKEEVHTISSEGLPIELKLDLIFRPVVAELYDLDIEIGANYYDEVIGPEFRTATRGVFARHSYLDIQKNNEALENEIEAEMRRRVAGKHVEISSVTLEEVDYAAQLGQAIQARLVGVEEAAHQKQRSEAALVAKLNERRLAEEQVAIDKLKAETAAATRLTNAKAEADSISLLAKAHAEEAHAQSASLTPLSVMVKAYEALANLGGENTHIMLGDWSKVPSFLFPQFAGLHPAK